MKISKGHLLAVTSTAATHHLLFLKSKNPQFEIGVESEIVSLALQTGNHPGISLFL